MTIIITDISSVKHTIAMFSYCDVDKYSINLFLFNHYCHHDYFLNIVKYNVKKEHYLIG